MKRILSICLIAAMVIMPGRLQASMAKRKSPTLAFGIALVPGAAIHGLGNFTAGEKKTGGILFALELIGAGMYFTDKNSSRGGEVLGLVGQSLFFGSYVYDVMSAPGAAQRFNRRMEREKAITFQLEPLSETKNEFPLQPTFRFTKRF